MAGADSAVASASAALSCLLQEAASSNTINGKAARDILFVRMSTPGG